MIRSIYHPWCHIGLLGLGVLTACNEHVSSPQLTTAALHEELRIDGTAENLVPISWWWPAAGVDVSSDGDIALSQSMDGSIRVFDSAGRLVRTLGSLGEGPAEFRAVGPLRWLGDSLWVHDGRLKRSTVFGPDGSVVETFATPTPVKLPVAGNDSSMTFPYVYPRRLLGDGHLLAMLDPSGNHTGSFEDRNVYALVSRRGDVQRIVASLDDGGAGVVKREDGVYSVPFANEPVEAIAPDASLVAAAAASTDEEVIVVVLLTAGGDTLFTCNYPFEPVPIPSSVRDSVASRYRFDMPIPMVYPPLEALMFGRDSTIWIEQTPRTDGRRPYLVLEPNGDPIGTVIMPRNARIAVAQRDRIWVLERDVLDVESLVRYRVDWPLTPARDSLAALCD